MSGDRVRDEAALGMRVQTEGGMEGQKGEESGLNGCSLLSVCTWLSYLVWQPLRALTLVLIVFLKYISMSISLAHSF